MQKEGFQMKISEIESNIQKSMKQPAGIELNIQRSMPTGIDNFKTMEENKKNEGEESESDHLSLSRLLHSAKLDAREKLRRPSAQERSQFSQINH